MTGVKKCDIVSISDKGRALNRVKVIIMNYIDLRTVEEHKIKTQIIVNTAYGCQDYDYIRISDTMYLLSKRAIIRIYRKLCRKIENVSGKLFLMKDINDTPGEHLVVDIIRGRIWTFNYQNMIVEIAASKLLNSEVR